MPKPDISTPSTPESQEPQRGEFDEIAQITGEEGLVAVFTERRSDGKISYTVFRTWPGGRSTYMGQRHIAAHRRLLARVDEKLTSMDELARSSRRAAAERA